MPQHNPLVTGNFVGPGDASSTSLSTNNLGGDLALGLGPVHITLIGLVVLSVVGLALLHKAGFRFAVTVGGR